MKLTFNFNIKGLDGKPYKGDENHAGKILASMLAQLNKGNSIKLWDWSQKLWNKTGIEVDDADAQILEGLIETTEQIPNITKAQLLSHIEDQRKKPNK